MSSAMRMQERVLTLKTQLIDAGLPVMDNPSHIVPVMVGDPVHCKAVTDTLLDHYGIYVQPINYPDGAARHRAHAAHALAGAYRRADGGADRSSTGAVGALPGGQRPICEARRGVAAFAD